MSLSMLSHYFSIVQIQLSTEEVIHIAVIPVMNLSVLILKIGAQERIVWRALSLH